MKHICKYCGKGYKNSHKGSNYCSRACRNKDNPINYTKEMRKAKSVACKGINKGEKNGMYGIGGELSPTWQGGISEYPYPKEWTEDLKISIRKRDNFVCQVCGFSGFHVHHIDYDKKNCSYDNLITLCKHCHPKTNFNRDTWKNFFEEIMRLKNDR